MSVINWTQYRPALVVSNFRGTYIELPVFSVTEGIVWKGASEVVLQFNYSAPKDFVLLARPEKPTGVNYGLCIRYRVGDMVTRYKLWEDELFVLSQDAAPLYNGQRIRANFVLEIWSFSELTEVSQDEVIDITTSIRNNITGLNDRGTQLLAEGAEFSDLQSGSGGASPLTGQYFWYDINAPLSNYSDPIQVWYGRNEPGGQYDLTAQNVGTSPAFVEGSAEINGLNYVSFDGVDDALFGQKAYDFPMTYYVYMKAVNPVLFAFYISMQGTVKNSNLFAIAADTIEALYSSEYVAGTIVANAWMVVMVQVVSGNKVKIRINNGAIVESAGAPVVDSGINTINLGCNALGGAPGADFGECGMTEFIGYNEEHTEEQMNVMYDYFNRKYQGSIPLPLTFNTGGPWLSNDPL